MNFVSGKPDSLNREVISELGKYRYRVFVEMLGWDLDCAAGNETDQFDGPDTHYVIGRGPTGTIGAVARLWSTDRPYLLRNVFPQLMAGRPMPHSKRIWELSRFAAVDVGAKPTSVSARGQFSSKAAVGLLRETLRIAAVHRVERLITVSPVGVQRLLNRAGFNAHPAAAPVEVNGVRLFACWLDVGARHHAMAGNDVDTGYNA
ncbi:acyl-homoserine-lactone synthase [Burkholderia thailandensis]|uniref:acyl-homoserine-lactone synthase n=1 Tax=Burkholderia thailandensis TaxID=57975 RepID=UPI0022AC1CDF|nr:acyl-homoserine-lactone synthase [Burkholderia thailandensis]MCZ2903640.1 N-acylhomoserine lactone synthase [Burkholderia thailandensis]MDD1484589.1 N-acylhomoserine lactone synthase [Burkholderia thailandensis]MDD1490607.1 N-acylhomoserine lactone synthase [Burkholderia thailandensis]MDD1496709.1 N-acylhomoserine lactone synthase [Burkholderia thailandensis]